MLLIERDLWEIVDGTEQAPEDRSEVESSTKARASAEAAIKWAKNDRKAIAAISQTIGDAELVHIRNAASSAEAWTKLAEVYEDKGLARKIYLRKRFFGLQKAEDETMQQLMN